MIDGLEALLDKVDYEGDMLYVLENWPDLVPVELRDLAKQALAAAAVLRSAIDAALKQEVESHS